MMNILNQSPLTDCEIEELDVFLMDSEGIEEAMDIASLDGFLTAILCGPKTIMPSEWMRWVWDMEKGEDSPEFKTQEQAQRIIGHNAVKQRCCRPILVNQESRCHNVVQYSCPSEKDLP